MRTFARGMADRGDDIVGDGGIEDWYQDIPLITKYFGAAILITSALIVSSAPWRPRVPPRRQ